MSAWTDIFVADSWEMVSSGLGGGHYAPMPRSRGHPLLPAEPLSQFTKDCREFVSRVDGVTVTGGSKKEFTIRVTVSSRTNEDSKVTFDIKRSADQVASLQSEILEACRLHPRASVTGLPQCAMCEQYKVLPPLPTGSDRLFTSAVKIHKTIEDRLNRFIMGACVAPTNTEYYCEGQVSVPVAVSNFLLRGVDDLRLLK